MQQTDDTPTDRNGNEILDSGTISDLQPDKHPDLDLVQGGSYEIDQILDHIGVEQDRESIIAEDSYSSLWVNVENGEYTEVWGAHVSVPYLHKPVYRLR
jgi:hypothetical protein